MIKLVASDLDGTLLLNGAQKLPEKIFPLIRELKKNGNSFCGCQWKTISKYEKTV